MTPFVVTLALCGPCRMLPARAADANTQEPGPPDQRTLDARRHFKAGIKLYRDGNYAGALAEFEEAYRLKPGPGSLQNVALSQKALFRYAEAVSTLEQLLKRHGGELTEPERKAVDEALGELRSLVGTIKLSVAPASARVLLDGRVLSQADLDRPIAVNVGEHALSVDAPGYVPERRLLRVPGGAQALPVSVQLRCVAGFVEITTDDASANIAIDGLPKARGQYRGAVEPNKQHLLQVYRDGVEPFERMFRVGLCETTQLHAKLSGKPAARVERDTGATSESGSVAQAKGLYVLFSLDLLALSRQPLSLDVKSASGGVFGSIGGRFGYRLADAVAFGLLLDAGALEVKGAIDRDGTVEQKRDYSLRSLHLGPELKLMTTGDRLRFVANVGTGVVHHTLTISAAESDVSAAEVRALDPFFALELNLGFNFRHFMGEIGLVTLIDGSSALKSGFTDQKDEQLTRDLGTTIPMVGLGLRGGYSEWQPAR